MTGQAAIAVVEALVDAFNRRDQAAVAALLHDDVVCQGMPLPAAEGLAATMDMLAPFLAADEIDWQIVAIAAAGDTVFTERVDRFRFAGADWTQVCAAGVFHIGKDGRIVAWRDYFDMAELLGAMPPASGG